MSRERGFTLIEIILATALFAMLMSRPVMTAAMVAY